MEVGQYNMKQEKISDDNVYGFLTEDKAIEIFMNRL